MQVKLDANGDMLETYSVMNYVLRDGEMQSVEVFKCCADGLESSSSSVIWPERRPFFFTGRLAACRRPTPRGSCRSCDPPRRDSSKTLFQRLHALGGSVPAPRHSLSARSEQKKGIQKKGSARPGDSREAPIAVAEILRLGALLSMSGSWAEGRFVTGALPLAVERVNEDTGLLPGHTLEYVFADSGCSRAKGLKALGTLLGEGQLDAVIGPGCSVACEPTAYLADGQNLAQASPVLDTCP